MKNLYIFAGVNGAGKSTFYINEVEKNFFYGFRINSDEIVKEFGDWKNKSDQNRAGKIALKFRKICLNRGYDFNIETTLSGHGIVKFINEAKKENYNITLFYIGLKNLELCKERVSIRKEKNGHDIDKIILERRFEQSFKNLKKILPICDNIFFYDNSEIIKNEEQQKFSNLELIAKKENNKIIRISTKEFVWFEECIKEINIIDMDELKNSKEYFINKLKDFTTKKKDNEDIER